MKKVIGIIYLIVALYLGNLGLGFIKIPEAMVQFDKWVLIVGAVLILISGVKMVFSQEDYLGRGRGMFG